MSPKCLHRRFWGRFSNCFSNLAQQIRWSKDDLPFDAVTRLIIVNPKKTFVLWSSYGAMSP
jgi:hypothetical protein